MNRSQILLRHRILLVILAVVAIGFGLILLLYVRNLHNVTFVADDFSYARRVHDYGLIGAQYSWYWSSTEAFTGRLASTLLISLSVSLGLRHIGLALVAEVLAVLVICVLGIYTFLNHQFNRTGKLTKVVIAASAVIALFIVNMIVAPSAYQTTLWAPGLAIYFLPPYIMLAGYAFAFSAPPEQQRDNLSLVNWFGLVLIVFASLMSETIALFGLLSLLIVLLFSYAYTETFTLGYEKENRKRLLRTYGLVALLVVSAFLIEYLAPGTQIRKKLLTPSTNIFDSLRVSLIMSTNYIGDALFRFWNFLLILGIIGFFTGRLLGVKSKNSHTKGFPLRSISGILGITLLATTALSMLALFPSHFSSQDIPIRTEMLPAFILASSLFLCGVFINMQIRLIGSWGVVAFAFLFLAFSVIGIMNFKKQYYPVHSALIYYREASLKRDLEIKQNRVDSKSALVVYTVLPPIYDAADLGESPTDWFNIDLAKYYKVKSLSLGLHNE